MTLALGKKVPAENTAERVDALDWAHISQELDDYGCALLPQILAPEECDALAALYPAEEHFRKRIVMERHGFGRGEYKYFRYPLPEIISELRTTLYRHLTEVANR